MRTMNSGRSSATCRLCLRTADLSQKACALVAGLISVPSSSGMDFTMFSVNFMTWLRLNRYHRDPSPSASSGFGITEKS